MRAPYRATGARRSARRNAPIKRLRPSLVAVPARNHMHVQLRYLIAERSDVELVAFGDCFERTGGGGDLAQELDLCGVVEVDEFDQSGPPRHQDQPGKIGVVGQQHARERQVTDGNGVLRQLRMKRPCRFHLSAMAGRDPAIRDGCPQLESPHGCVGQARARWAWVARLLSASFGPI
jgi:hypothetical protein